MTKRNIMYLFRAGAFAGGIMGAIAFHQLPISIRSKIGDPSNFWIAKTEFALGNPIGAAWHLDAMRYQPGFSEDFIRFSATVHYEAAEAYLKKGNRNEAAENWADASTIAREGPIDKKDGHVSPISNLSFPDANRLDQVIGQVNDDEAFAEVMAAVKENDCAAAAEEIQTIDNPSRFPAFQHTVSVIRDCLDDMNFKAAEVNWAKGDPMEAQSHFGDITNPARFPNYAALNTQYNNAADDIHWQNAHTFLAQDQATPMDQTDVDDGAVDELKKIINPNRFPDFNAFRKQVTDAADDNGHALALLLFKQGNASEARRYMDDVVDASRFPNFATESIEISHAADDEDFTSASSSEKEKDPGTAQNYMDDIRDPSRFAEFSVLKDQIVKDWDDDRLSRVKDDLAHNDRDQAKADLRQIEHPERIKEYGALARMAGLASPQQH